MSSSTSWRSASTISAGATGTANTSFAGLFRRTAFSEARTVAPVAMPSSTIIAVRPSTETCARPFKYMLRRRLISASCLSANRSISSFFNPARETMCSLTTISGLSPFTIAAAASSRCRGRPILRTITKSIGASNFLAISTATGTPPRGSASITGSM